jgi:flagellar basal body-associated protein FliL
MIGLIVLFAAFGVVLIVYFYTTSPATSHGGKQKLNTTSNKKGNPNPFQSLDTLRENLCGKLSDHAHELKVMLGLPDKNAQVTIAVDMVSCETTNWCILAKFTFKPLSRRRYMTHAIKE